MTFGEPLLTVPPAGRNVRRLSSPTRRQSDGPLYSVAASPNGRWATFVRTTARNGTNEFTVQLVSLVTRRIHTLARDPAPLAFAPAPWSPDGRWIAIAMRLPFDTWLLRQDGSGGHALDAAGSPFNARAFSPNGHCLVGFEASPGTPTRITIVRAGGGAPTPVPGPAGPFNRVDAMRWTPDGRQIVFTGQIGRTAAIYRMAPDGTGVRRLVRLRSAADAAVFSPDGRWMAYNDRRGTMVRPVSGGRAHRLLTRLWIKAWAPRPR